VGIPTGTRFNAFPYPIQKQGRPDVRNTDGETTSPDVGSEHLPNLIFPLSLKTLSRRRTHATAQSPFRPRPDGAPIPNHWMSVLTPVQSELPTRPVPSGSDQAVKIRVETTDGARHELEGGWMSSDSVGGVSALTTLELSRSFPLTQVRTVEESKLNGARSYFLVMGVGALTFVGFLWIGMSQAIGP